jgi:hypothetical protein
MSAVWSLAIQRMARMAMPPGTGFQPVKRRSEPAL